MTVETPPMMAAGWAQQPAAPPSAPTRRLVTPAARAFLRSRNISLGLDPGTELPRIVHLAEAHALARAAAARPDSAPCPGARAPRDAWAGVEVPIPPAQQPTRRLARVTAAAVAAPRGSVTPPVRAVITVAAPVAATDGSVSVVLDDADSLSVSGIERLLAAGGDTRGETVDARVEVIDGSGLGVTRLLACAGGRVVVAIGAPARRVVPRSQHDGQEVIAVSWVLEVWVHGGGVLGPPETARPAGAVARALETVDRA
jgi:hypothetical protein